MAGITLTQAESKLSTWLAAEDAVATGQSYTIETSAGRRTLTRADLAEVRKAVQYWDGMVKRLSEPAGNRRRTRYVTPKMD